MKLLIISDIHGNLSALDAVLQDAEKYEFDAIAILGDLIDYGMRSNEVVECVASLKIPVLCNIPGNHEYAVLTDDYACFSSHRGVKSAQYTKSQLSDASLRYLRQMQGKNGSLAFEAAGKRFLAVHGSLKDPFWGAISPNGDFSGYEDYDYVLSGHSHLPHCFPVFYPCDQPEYRNKKRTVFINPGSVGQPRNHDPRAQYAILDTDGNVFLLGAEYNIEYEQSLYHDEIDVFYKERLTNGV